MIYILLPITGIFVGILSTIFGVGGGIIAVPILYLMFPKISPQLVISTSMGMIFINSLINTRNFLKQGKKITLHFFFTLSLGMTFGVIIGTNIVNSVSPTAIKKIFGVTLLLVAIKTVFSKTDPRGSKEEWAPPIALEAQIKYLLACLLAGTLAGTTGLGGGAILVPVFISLLKTPYNWVSFLSNICMGSGALVGVLSYLFTKPNSPIFRPENIGFTQINSVNFGLITLLSLGALLSSKLGVRLGERLDPTTSKRLFAGLLIIISSKILYNSLNF